MWRARCSSRRGREGLSDQPEVVEGLGEEDGAGEGACVVVVGLVVGAPERCEEELRGLSVVGAGPRTQRGYFPASAFAPAPASVSASLARMVSAAGCSSSRRSNASLSG